MIDLAKELEKTKAKMFTGNTGAFYGSLVCSTDFVWDEKITTACTNGIYIKFNPDFFTRASEVFRVFVLAHDLRHIALLHGVRRGIREPRKWNRACDYEINEQLVKEGYSYDGNGILLNRDYFDKTAEEIYELLDDIEEEDNDLDGDFSESELGELNKTVIANVVKAMQVATLGHGEVPGTVKEHINKILKTEVRWEDLLNKLLTDFIVAGSSWRRPNRRHQDIYLPSKYKKKDKLQKINFYFDVSGSVTNEQTNRFLSEVRNIKLKFNPKELNLIQFDTIIQDELCIKSSDSLESMEIVGRGGTDLRCVREHILLTKPTAAIIFTDLECLPMEPIGKSLELIWLVYGTQHKPLFGKYLYLKK